MNTYRVVWEIDIDTDGDAEWAACKARGMQLRPEAEVGCFTVTDRATGATVEIDLDAEGES